MESQTGNTSKIHLNIGGKHFVTSVDTLSSIPGTKLAELSNDDPSFDSDMNEYYFDRNHVLFGAILDVYRYGEFHFPHCLCGSFVRKELDFWRIPDKYIAVCCQRQYGHYEEEQKQIDKLHKMFNETKKNTQTPDTLLKRKDVGARLQQFRWAMWRFLEDPSSSISAKVWGVFFLFVIMTSVTMLVILSDPSFRYSLDKPLRNLTGVTNPKVIMYLSTSPHSILINIDNACFFIFAAELLLRFFVCPNKCTFFKGAYNILDILCVVPMGITIITDTYIPSFWDNDTLFNMYSGLSILSVFRVFRLLKFASQFTGIKVLLLALRSSFKELALLMLLMAMGILIFSCSIYYAEFYQGDNFHNIPIGFWWSIVTMTTVGYGDKHPKSGWGYLVGAICAICGMLSTGLPIPIIANNFNFYYSFAKSQKCLEKRRANIRKHELQDTENSVQNQGATSLKPDEETQTCELQPVI